MAKKGGRIYKYLNKISSPQDLKALSSSELKILAEEIRDKIITTVSETGGHLAPNLGTVELSIALHRALDSPKDKIVWDVGHQAYTHKLLTGRRDSFNTLRQYGGLAGFPRRDESEHDVFDSGHASSSVAIALGLAEARDKRETDETVVAVIGDGALTGGVAYEALNQVGHLGTHLIVVLNDNVMSISLNVGAMSSYLARVRLDPTYNKLRDEIERRIKEIPGVGGFMYAVGERVKDSLKHLLVPGMLFEELGFKYIGPIDGHNIEAVEYDITRAKEVKGPVLIHVLTKKGKGYDLAEEHPEKFHGPSPFLVKTGEPKKRRRVPTYAEIFGETVVDLAAKNDRIIAITAAMTVGTGLTKFKELFPDRFYDVGIAEQDAVTFAAGLALGGFIPVVAIYSTFLERAYDQMIQDIALQNLHVIFALDRAGLVGEDGPTHHGAFDLSYLRHIPGLTVMAPKDEEELRHMLYTATKMETPVVIRYPRGSGEGVELTSQFRKLEVGKAEVLQKGERVCLIAIGRMVSASLKAADLLRKKDISPTVINARFAKPIDKALIYRLCPLCELVVTVEENSRLGGFGSAVVEVLTEEKVQVPILRLGLPDKFVTHGATSKLLAELGLDGPGIATSIEKELEVLKSRLGNSSERPGQVGTGPLNTS